MIKDAQTVLLVEDGRDDQQLTIRGLKHGNQRRRPRRPGRNRPPVRHRGTNRKAPSSGGPARPQAPIGGLEVLKRIHAEERTRPPVVIPGSTNNRDLINGCDLGGKQLRPQGIGFDQFATAVVRLERQLADDQRPPPACRGRHPSRPQRLGNPLIWSGSGLVGATGRLPGGHAGRSPRRVRSFASVLPVARSELQ